MSQTHNEDVSLPKNVESLILKNLFFDLEYTRKVIPHLKEEYFSESRSEKEIFSVIKSYVSEYDKLPNIDFITVEINEKENLSQDILNKCNELLKSFSVFIKKEETSNTDFLLKVTEKWAKEQALYNAAMQMVEVVKGDKPKAGILKEFENALSVSFENNIGHDYFDDVLSRYDYYHEEKHKLEFGIKSLNIINKGGVAKKSLNLLMAPTGVGKSVFMCDFASSYLKSGYNVLYITLEMTEEEIAERIDLNLLNATSDDIRALSKELLCKKINNLREKTTGKLKVKSYPMSSAGTTHFRNLLSELKLKSNFIPDIVFIDYLNISTTARNNGKLAKHEEIKCISEDFKRFAHEQNVVLWSATQTNRSGIDNSDVELDSVSEAFSLTNACDLFWAIISTQELENSGQILIKQLKNRHNDMNKFKKFLLGLDRSRMKLHDIDNFMNSVSKDVSNTKDVIYKKSKKKESKVEDVPVFDKSDFGIRDSKNKRKLEFNFE